MEPKKGVIEKSKSVQDMHHLRLMSLLQELERDHGRKKAAAILGVDRRTLDASLDEGLLSRRIRGALERALQSGVGSAAREQRDRNDKLADRMADIEKGFEELGKEVRVHHRALEDANRGLREEWAEVQRRLERTVSELRAGGGRDDNGRVEAGEASSGDPPPRKKKLLRREFPDLVTLEPADDDEEVFGDAWPLIVEWRELKATHPDKGRGLDWLRTEERFMSVELALLEEHGLTLPPATFPLRGFDRNGQVNWRRTALSDTRRALAWREFFPRAWRSLRAKLRRK
ncbi:MAG: hypothetical protein F4Y02_04235 [Chloroflexi bacterium]|nr:hypothetical protein [Chloroflexota bacterium]